MKAEEKLMSHSGKIQDTKFIEGRNKNLIRQAAEEIYNKGNYSHVDEIISSDFIIHSLNPNKEIHGIDGAKKFVIALRTAFPDIKLAIKDQFAEGDKVVTHFIVEGTHQGTFEGIPPTGKSFRISSIDIDYIKDGKISDCWTSLDELSLLQQLGVLG